jgi:prepilin-type N-terminal cleavage/methylation domain-containing protein
VNLKMKPHPQHNHTARRGMTLIELLVVISIIGVLAGLILPAVGNVKKKAKVVQAQKDMADLRGAINVYQHDYNRLPASTPATQAVGDFTYGTTGTGYGTNIFNTGVGAAAVAGPYEASNAELIAILSGNVAGMPGYTPHASVQSDAKNPRKTQYFNGKAAPGSAGATAGPGIGPDGVFRDPWSNPYIVSLDLNYDNVVFNSLYRLQAVSQVAAGSPGGLFGLVGTGNGNNNNYSLRDTVMVFSFGPDGMFDGGTKANDGVNKDNVLSWK